MYEEVEAMRYYRPRRRPYYGRRYYPYPYYRPYYPRRYYYNPYYYYGRPYPYRRRGRLYGMEAGGWDPEVSQWDAPY